jgi:hypothetical protein
MNRYKILTFVIFAHCLVLSFFYSRRSNQKKTAHPIAVQTVLLKPKPQPKKIETPQQTPQTMQSKKVSKPSKQPKTKPIKKELLPIPVTPPTPQKIAPKQAPAPIDIDDQIQAYFKSFHLPEYGKVVLKISVKNNQIEQIEVLESQSEENLSYLKTALEKFAFPYFDKNQNQSHTFVIHFQNELTE